jgi:acyl-CoA synthetase (AMP-forming)/AMP-acid ligase II
MRGMPFPDFEPTAPNLIARFEERHGDRPLVLLGDRRLTYAEAGAESARVAQGLLARGVGKGTRVGILFPNGPDWVVGWLAAARIGALVVPINTFSKPRELAWLLRHADIHTLLTAGSLLSNDYQDSLERAAPSLARQSGQAPLVCPELPHLRQVFVFGATPRGWASGRSELDAAGKRGGFDRSFLAEVEREVSPADLMLLVYSSGSTAEPKGVLHSHGALIRQSWNLNSYRNARPDDVLWTPMPFFWIGGFGVALLQTMLEGGFVLCQEAFEPGATLELMERERATYVMGWPQYATALANHPDFGSRDLSSVREGSLYPLLPDEARPRDPELRANSLGMTETCGPHTYDRMDVELPERLRGSFGRALEGVTHRVIDPETGRTLPPGELGEICVRGYNLMQGLYKREREDVFEPDGFYRTGDSGYFDADGYLYFRARLSEMIKTGGANVTPREVEVAIDAQPEVQCSFVVGVPHPERGQNVAAAIVLNAGAALDEEELRTRLKQEISAYKVPRHFFFCERSELPFTDSGKMQKTQLTEMLTSLVGGSSGRCPA